MALAYLVGTATQGGADAFVQSEVATALTGISTFAYRVRELIFEIPTLAGANLSNVEVCLTRRTKAAMPNISDRDVIAKFKRQTLFTTSGSQNFPMIERFTYSEDDDLLIVEDPLYFQLDTNATSAANTAYVRIGYERVSISAVDRLTILTASLD